MPHPEGGYFKESYRSPGQLVRPHDSSERSHSTAIYFLLKEAQVSHLHKIQSDEVWHFYDGQPLVIHEISESGEFLETVLGRNISQGKAPARCSIWSLVWCATFGA